MFLSECFIFMCILFIDFYILGILEQTKTAMLLIYCIKFTIPSLLQ